AWPVTRWDELSARLREEGLIADRRRSPIPTWAWRAAAALALVGGGAAAGRYTAGRSAGGAEPLAAAAGTAVVPVANVENGFRSNDEALAALARAQGEYQRAAAFLAAH